MSSDSATYSSDEAGWRKVTDYYCGLEANVTNPTNGVTALLYIGDSFASSRVCPIHFIPHALLTLLAILLMRMVTEDDPGFGICRHPVQLM